MRIATRLGIFGEVLHALLPRVAQIVMNTTLPHVPGLGRRQGRQGRASQLSAEAIAMQQMMRGIHF